MDKKWVKAHYQLYFRQLVLFAHELVHDLDIAQDIVQDVFVKLLQPSSSFVVDHPKAFLYQTVKRKCLDHLKSKDIKTNHHKRIIRSLENDHLDIHQEIESKELEEKIMVKLSQLPEKRRVIFQQSRFEGKTNDQIAEALQISKRTVETQISKVLKELRKLL